MYVWRGRLKKKRGTSLLGRLQRELTTVSLGVMIAGGIEGAILNVNIFSVLGLSPGSIVPGSIGVHGINTGGFLWSETSPGVITNPDGLANSTINYATGQIVLNENASFIGLTALITFSYYPTLPVMGLEDFQTGIINFPDLVAFDTRYSYEFNQSTNEFYDVTFYKGSGAPFTWSGADYQQFWSTNYQGAMWVTNGVAGFNFATITAITNFSGTTATVTLNNPNLIVGDQLFFYEVQGAVVNLNGAVGTITANGAAPTYTVTFPATQAVTTFSSGIVQLLTDFGTSTSNGLKFYDGDPTISTSFGWVNFAPPLSNLTQPEYLIGADEIFAFKNRLLFFGVTIATSAAPGGIYYPNRMVYSENGTPYYNSLVPVNQTFNVMAWFQNVAGFGGFLSAPIPQSIVTVEENGDVLLTGYESKQLKLIFTGDDSFPFYYQTINSELGSQSTFSGVSLDTGAITIGDYGIALTTQVSAERIDLVIPDQVFEISALNNGSERVTSIRDYRNEFIYFTYPPKNRPINIFNSKTLLYNYRDNTWATFDENYTHYGTFRRSTNITWATLNTKYKTWTSWTDPWNFGSTGSRYPNIIGGNQQGFVLIKDDGTYEDTSQYISAINLTTFIVTSPDHCLNSGDYIEILNALGVTNLNSQIYLIQVLTTDTFQLLLSGSQMANPPTGTYIGAGIYRRLTNIFVQSKQFPIYWNEGRQTRIGTQKYFVQNAPNPEEGPPSQITANIFTSQNTNFPSSDPAYGYLPFSNILLTGPEPMKPFQISQDNIWHRMSNSFIGDTVQIGFELSDAQMRVNTVNEAEIIIQAIAFDLHPGPILV